MADSYARYAIYWAPERESALARFGAAWLGYDAEAGGPRALPAGIGPLPRPREALVAAPRRYGFHATLRAPFRLATDVAPADLDAALAMFAAATRPPEPVLMQLDTALGFVAITPARPAPALDALAAAVVRHFQPFAARPAAPELSRRRGAGLPAEAEANLLRWGYPWVMSLFRFHLTLTGQLTAEEADDVAAALAPVAEKALADPVPVTSLCLFGDPGGGRPFRMLARHPLGTPARRPAALPFGKA